MITASKNVMAAGLIEEMARLLDSFRPKSCGWHGSGRHIGEDFSLCEHSDRYNRPCSARCAAVQRVIAQAADELGVSPDDLAGWPKRRGQRIHNDTPPQPHQEPLL